MCIFFFIALVFVNVIIYIRNISSSISKTGESVFITSSVVSLIALFSILFFILVALVTQTKEKSRKDSSSEFFEGMVNHLYRISKNPDKIEEEVKYVIEDAKNAAHYGVRPAKWFEYASFKSVRYVIEYLSRGNHVAAMRRMLEEGTPAAVIGKYLKRHVTEHHQIKDTRDIYLAEKYLK
jgi:hypothetical protein